MEESTPGAAANGSTQSDVDRNAVYALGHNSAESERLQRQADELAPDTSFLLDRVGLHPGDSAIDLGCGPRGIIELLAERVSPGGRVVDLDGDPAHVGGCIAGMEPDTEGAICYPPDPAFDRLCEIFAGVFTRNGADPHIGRRLAELYRRAGLEDVTVEARARVYPAGHSRRTIRADLVRSMRPQILELGLADEHELDEVDAAARKHFDDPDTIVMPHLMWGRKPAATR
jgi:hypothetical protein